MGNCASFHPKQNTIRSDNLEIYARGQVIVYANGLRIVKNQQTGKVEGIPEDWNQKYAFTFGVDQNKTFKTQLVPTEMRANREQTLPQAITKMADKNSLPKREKKKVPNRFNLQSDRQSPFGIKNLTPELTQILQKFRVSPSECRKNSDIYIQVLNLYYEEMVCKKEAQFTNTLISGQQHGEKLASTKFIEKNPAKYFNFYSQLGKGAFCKVFLTECKKNKKFYAVRILKIKDSKQIQKITQQVTVMKQLSSKYVVKYHCTFKYKGLLFMFIEHMKRGSLTQLIYKLVKASRKLEQETIAYILKQILLGIKSLHEKQQIHRDIKSDNVLIGQNGQIKIADFGYAIQLTKQKDRRVSLVGTPAWMAPQLILKKEYNQSVDIWSLGILAMELCNGQPPFFEDQHLATLKKILSHRIPSVEGYSLELKSFIDMCLQKDPKFRLGYKQLLNHPFLHLVQSDTKARINFKKFMEEFDSKQDKKPTENKC